MLDPTLYGLLSHIERDDVVLPAMQRPFVWEQDRICRLMDSLLRGFPIGATMLWNTRTIQRYRRIQRDVCTDTSQEFAYESLSGQDTKYLVLDGQQRLTSLFVAFKGTFNHRRLYLNILSGDSEGKDPGNEYFECRFLDTKDATALNMLSNGDLPRQCFIPVGDLIKIDPNYAAEDAYAKARELALTREDGARISRVYIRCANVLADRKSLQVIVVDEDARRPLPIEEVLEIFVRVNSGGLVLQKSDLLMSLLDLKWNNVQPELQRVVREINRSRPFSFTRDDVLKSLLLMEGAETRFDKLVSARHEVERLAEKLPEHMAMAQRAWETLGCILTDNCRIFSERFFRGGHNALLPFVVYLADHDPLLPEDRRKITIGIYLAIMSGVFAGAETRMGDFTTRKVAPAATFPLAELVRLVKREYGIRSLDDLLRRHLDLALNIAHGGITLDKNPENLQRDHIFPKATLGKAGVLDEKINYYANFHFLRGSDNLNKTDKPPHDWFREPGKNPPYTEQDLKERLLTWEDLEADQFEAMLERRGRRIRQRAEPLFGMSEADFNRMFEDPSPTAAPTGAPAGTPGGGSTSGMQPG